MPKKKETDWTPKRKVVAGAFASGLGIILTWMIGLLFGVDVPGEVGAAIPTVLGPLTAYMVPEG